MMVVPREAAGAAATERGAVEPVDSIGPRAGGVYDATPRLPPDTPDDTG